MSSAGGEGPEAGTGRAGGRSEPEAPGSALSVDLPGLLGQLARSFALLLPVYALGYLGLSFSWVLLALGLLAWCRRSRGLKASRLCRALALLEDEEQAVRLGVRACDLPAWVSVVPDPSGARSAPPFSPFSDGRGTHAPAQERCQPPLAPNLGLIRGPHTLDPGLVRCVTLLLSASPAVYLPKLVPSVSTLPTRFPGGSGHRGPPRL